MQYRHLDIEERHKIAALRGLRFAIKEIALRLGRHPSTLYRELKRNASAHDGRYRSSHSIEKASARKKLSRRKPRFGPEAFVQIEDFIRLNLSPEQIVGRLRLEGTEVMSHETIYRWIWRDKASGGWLWMHLRGARKQCRKRYGRYDSRGRLAGKKMITSRPAAVQARRRIGDWEIDTVHGCGTACVLTVVERRTGLLRIGALPRATKERTTRRSISLLRDEP